jgi:VanZ like family
MDTVLARAQPEINLTRTILNQPGVLAAFVLLCVLFGVGTWLAARRLGWHRLFATLAAIGLSLAIAVTLVRPGGHLPNPSASPVSMCLHDQFSLHGGLQVLNLLMLMPFAFFGMLATRRPITLMVASTFLSAGIELTQAWTGLGVCQKQDFLNNTFGAIIAAALAWLLLSVLGHNRAARDHQQVRRPLERV